jgi:hypothetical protein
MPEEEARYILLGFLGMFWPACVLIFAHILLGLFLDTEEEGDTFIRNVDGLPSNYRTLQFRSS